MKLAHVFTYILMAVLVMLVVIRITLVNTLLDTAEITQGEFLQGGIALLVLFVVVAFAVNH